MIIQTMTESAFAHEMMEHGFTYNGGCALFEDLKDFDIEFDPIAIRCDFTEYADIDEILDEYKEIEDIDDLRNNTHVIEFNTGIIIQDF